MVNCEAPKNFTLDLRGLKSLRVLILESVSGMVEIACSWRGDGDEGCLQELRFVRLLGWDLVRIPFLIECDNLKWLSIDVVEEEFVDFFESLKVFENLKALEVVHLLYIMDSTYVPFEGIFNSILGLQSLRFLEVDLEPLEDNLERDIMSVDVSPLGGLPMLSALSLNLWKFHEVEGLDQLSGLSTLVLQCSNSELEGVNQLSKLTTVALKKCQNLRQLPIDRLPNLQEVCVEDCCSLEDPICLLENYKEIKNHTSHECHQPFCNWDFCAICVDRHRRSGVTCQMQVDCNICDNWEDIF